MRRTKQWSTVVVQCSTEMHPPHHLLGRRWDSSVNRVALRSCAPAGPDTKRARSPCKQTHIKGDGPGPWSFREIGQRAGPGRATRAEQGS